jgi:hypothetical protein
MADFPTAPKRTEICDSCGKPITVEVGITYVGSTDGRFWHYGCARENTRPTVSSLGDDAMVERVARAIEAETGYSGDIARRQARAAIAAMTG